MIGDIVYQTDRRHGNVWVEGRDLGNGRVHIIRWAVSTHVRRDVARSSVELLVRPDWTQSPTKIWVLDGARCIALAHASRPGCSTSG